MKVPGVQYPTWYWANPNIGKIGYYYGETQGPLAQLVERYIRIVEVKGSPEHHEGARRPVSYVVLDESQKTYFINFA